VCVIYLYLFKDYLHIDSYMSCFAVLTWTITLHVLIKSYI